tara:strand:+ start:373 stop:555 length:183 start_codon:yes stop_codon:yes gene_type:complete
MLEFKTYYYPFSFDEPESIKTRIEIHKDGKHIETEDFTYILEEKELDAYKQFKREYHESC